MDLELRQLRGFVAVAEERSFSRAAERLHLTQPALTRQIQALERAVDAQLFQRTTRHVGLTPAGEALLSHAQQALAAAIEGAAAVRTAAQGGRPIVRFALAASGNLDFAPEVLRSFRECHPDVEVDVTRVPTALAVERLKHHELDVALVRPPLHDAENLDCRLLFHEPMLAVLPSAHPYAREQIVDRDQLAKEPFIIFSRHLGPGGYDLITSYLWPGIEDPESRIIGHRPEEETMIQAVAAGIGVTIAFESRIRSLAIDGVAYRPLTPPLTAPLAIATRTHDLDQTLQDFIESTHRISANRPQPPTD